ncbi:hypothetical protein CD58_28985 [Pseudomonas brassicacearum]|uniref:hypothetical protein n=1 Tax=Pseudomonas brassicacearum TaxID=930166 RepID=UPI00042F56B8|nr:hypothetical protein [Pseudomonas brassicacearum]AHL36664.1 hypothetical protein CD58_28985 [Pseudomonas brassicacearum]
MTQPTGTLQAGTLDPTFADGGVLRFPIPEISGFDTVAVLALPENKLLVAIQLLGVEAPIALARLNENGSLDIGFGGNGAGLVEVSLEGGYINDVRELIGLSDGGWLLLGQYEKGSEGGRCLVRHDREGRLVESFGEKGVRLFPGGIAPRHAETGGGAFARVDERSSTGAPRSSGRKGASAVQQDGKILLLGYMRNDSGEPKEIVLRLNSDGSTDYTFNGVGFAIVEPPGISYEWNIAEVVTVQADGNVLVGGEFALENPYSRVAYVMRFDASGRLDTSFNGGMVPVRHSNLIYVEAIEVRETDGSIVTIGKALRDGVLHGLMFVLTRGGFFDFNFNRGQPLFSKLVPQGLGWKRIALQAEGSILVAGTTGRGFVEEGVSALTARFHSDGSLDSTFNGNGFTVFDEGGKYEVVQDMAVMADGRIVVCGLAWVDGDPWAYIGGGWVIRYLA